MASKKKPDAPELKPEAKTKAPKSSAPEIERGSVLIVKLAKGKTVPKPPPGVQVWALDGDQMVLTSADMYDRGWIRRKG